jgi:septal ring factor EnvC (AmiA/AmiB activator)
MRRLDNDRTDLRDAEDRLATLRTELAAQNTEVQAFLLNHKIAAACIRTSRVSWGSDAAPADEAAAGSRFGTAVCGVALLNGQFAREVAFVGEKLRETETRGKELKRQITALERTVESRRADLHAHESSVDELSAEVAAVRRQLSPD